MANFEVKQLTVRRVQLRPQMAGHKLQLLCSQTILECENPFLYWTQYITDIQRKEHDFLHINIT